MDELTMPFFFREIFKKIFGETAGFVMDLYMLSETPEGKEAVAKVSAVFDTPKGQVVLAGVRDLINKKILPVKTG